MDLEYRGRHSVTFYKYTTDGYIRRNSWTDYFLIPAKRPHVNLGEPKYNMVALPGTSERLDLTDVKPGGLTFGSRTGSWEFYIDHSRWDNWKQAYNVIKNYIHGNRFLVVLRDEPLKAYQGVLTIGGYVPGNSFSKITIQYDLSADVFILDEALSAEDLDIPDPTFVPGPDGKPWLDVDGDGEPDVQLPEGDGYDTDCDGKPDIMLSKDKSQRPVRKFITDPETKKIIGLDINGDGEADYIAYTDSNGVYGLNMDCDENDLVDYDLETPSIETETIIGYDTDCDGKEDVFRYPDSIIARYAHLSNGEVRYYPVGDKNHYYKAIKDSTGAFGFDFNCDKLVDELVDKPSDSNRYRKFILDCETRRAIYVKEEDVKFEELFDNNGNPCLDVNGDGIADYTYEMLKTASGELGWDFDCNGELDWRAGTKTTPEPEIPFILDCTTGRTIYVKVSNIEISLMKDINGNPCLDINGDGVAEYTYDMLKTVNGEKGWDFDCDGELNIKIDESGEEITDEPTTPDPVYHYIVDCETGYTKIVPTSVKPKAIKDDNDKIIGLDIDGDDQADYSLDQLITVDGKRGWSYKCSQDEIDYEIVENDPKTPIVYRYDTDCDENVDIEYVITSDDQEIAQFIYDKDTGIITGLDVDMDGRADYTEIIIDREDPNKKGFDTNCDGYVDYPVPEDDKMPEPPGKTYEVYTLCDNDDPEKRTKISVPAEKKDELCNWILNEAGTIAIGLDVDGDGKIDYTADWYGDRWGVDTDCDGDINYDAPREEKVPEPESEDVVGIYTNCVTRVGIPITIEDIPTTKTYYVKDEMGHVVAQAIVWRGEIYTIAITDGKGKQKGLKGFDYDCDGILDNIPEKDPEDPHGPEDPEDEPEGGTDEEPGEDETPEVIGAMYPIKFIVDGKELKNGYGVAKVNFSSKVFGVYDLYTIYKEDLIVPNHS